MQLKKRIERRTWTALALAAWSLPAAARGATKYWDLNDSGVGAGDLAPAGTWDTTTSNWNTSLHGTDAGATWAADDTAVFSAGTDAAGAFAITLSAPQSADSLRFEDGTVTVAAQTLTLTGSGSIDVAFDRLASINSAIDGTVGLVKTGAGTVVLGGLNTFTGSVNVRGGDIQLLSGEALTVTGDLNAGLVSGNGTMTVNGSGAALSVSGATLLGQDGFTGTANVLNGASATFSGSLTLAQSAAANNSGIMLVSGGGGVVAANLTIAAGGLTGQSGQLTVTGSGSSLVQSGAATLTVGTTANSLATLEVADSGVFTSGTGAISINSTGTVLINGGSFNANSDVTLNGGTLQRNNSGTFALAAGKNLTAQNGADVTIDGGGVYAVGANSTFNIESGSSFAVTGGGFLHVGTANGGGNGTVIVDGSGSSLSSPVVTFIARDGFTGAVTFKNGSTGALGYTLLGSTSTAGSAGILTVESGASISVDGMAVATGGGATTSGTINVAGTITETGVNAVDLGEPSTGSAILNVNSGGTFAGGAGVINVHATGQLNINGGTFTTPSHVAVNTSGGVAAGGSITLSGAGSTFTQSGAKTLTIGALSGGAGSVVVNSGGVFTTGTDVITIKPTGLISINDGVFNANGDVDVSGGTLSRSAAGAFNLAAGKQLVAASGGQVNFTGSYAIGQGSTFTVQSAADLSATSFIDVGNGSVGTVAVGGAGSSLTAGGSSTWGSHGGSATVTIGDSASVVINGDLSIAGSSVAGTSGAVTVQSTGTLTAGSISIAAAGGATTSGSLTVTGAGSSVTQSGGSSLIIGHATTGATLNVNSGATFTSGTGGITINPSGSLTIGGGTFVARGDMIVNGTATVGPGGALLIGTNGPNGSLTGNVTNNGTVTFNGTVNLTYAGVISGSGSLVKRGVGTLVLTNDNLYTGGTVVNHLGVLQIDADSRLGPGVLTLALGILYTTQDITTARTIEPGAGGGTIRVAAGKTLTLTSGVGAGTTELLKDGPGALVLQAASTRTGDTTLVDGILRVEHANALGTDGTGTTLIHAGVDPTRLELAGITVNKFMVLADSGSEIHASGTSGLSGVLSVNSAEGRITTAPGAVFTLGSAPNGVTGAGSLLVTSGAGRVVLPYSNDFSGAWNIASGTVRLEDSAALGTGVSQVTVGGTMELGGVTLDRNMLLLNGAVLRGTGTAASVGTMMIDSGAVMTFATTAGADVLTFGNGGADLTGGGGGSAIGVTGPGKVVLAQPSNYTGNWTVDASTLEVPADNHLGNDANTVTLDNGATLVATGIYSTNRNITLGSSQPVIDVPAGKALTATGLIQGTALRKTGSGDLAVGGALPNTYGGATQVSAGKLIVLADGALGAAGSATTDAGNTFLATGSASTLAFSSATSLDYTTFEMISTDGTGAPGFAQVDNLSGDNKFAGQIAFAGPGDTGSIGVTAGSLEVQGGLFARGATATRTLSKSGAGILIVSGASGVSSGNPLVIPLASSTFNVNQGTVELKGAAPATQVLPGVTTWNMNSGGTLRNASGTLAAPNVNVNAGGALVYSGGVADVGALAISGGNGSITPGGNKVLRTGTLSVTGTGQLDLADNKLIVTSGSVGGISGLIQSGRNQGAWNGSGIVTSMTDAQPNRFLTTLATAAAGDVSITNFGGVSVLPADVLVMYTYAGDADLSGYINGDDYFRIDDGYTDQLTGYANGDFNYDGLIDADDYFLINANYARETAAFSPGAVLQNLGAVQAVPEPAGLTALLGAAALCRRRRRCLRQG